MAFQYIQPQLVDYSSAFEPFIRARAAHREQNDKRAEMLLRQQANDREQARLDEQIRHTRQIEERQQGLDVASALPKIKDMLTPGHPSYDPETALSTARAYGIQLDKTQPPAPVAPERPDIGPTQLEYGPRATPEIAQQAAILSAKTSPDQPEARADEIMNLDSKAQAERRRFEQANDPAAVSQNQQRAEAFLGAQNDYQRKLDVFHRTAPTYHGQSPIGQVDIDPNAAIASRQEQQRRQREELAGLGNIPGMESLHPTIQALIVAGADKSVIGKFIQGQLEEQGKNRHDDKFKTTAEEQMRHNRAMEAAAMANARARSAGAGDFDPAVGAAISKYLTENPGDMEGAFKVAGAMGSAAPGKTVSTVAGLTKPTESQAKDARQAAIGKAALDEIQQSGYVPNKDDIQTWLNNQKQVDLAQKAGAGGGITGLIAGGAAGIAQRHGALAQSEIEGLPPDAQRYFGNVRRYMESIGRAQSGAAISPTEWQNFFNQYGPNSPGGGASARRYFEDQAITGGVATRQLQAPRRAAPPNESRADTLKRGGKRKSLEELEAESGL